MVPGFSQPPAQGQEVEDAERFLLGHNVLSQQEAREHHQYFLSVYSLKNGCIVCQVQTLVHQARQSKTAHGLPDYHDRTKMVSLFALLSGMLALMSAPPPGSNDSYASSNHAPYLRAASAHIPGNNAG